MADMIEIRWHGRGGQGVKTACEFVASVAIHAGKYGQGFPEYGPERAGAPVKGFTRISSTPITQHCAIYKPDVVLVLDENLMGPVNVCEGVGEKRIVIVNTEKSPGEVHCGGGNVWTVNATKIAIEEIGRPIPNMPMVGALLRVTGILDLEALLGDVEKQFSDKFDKKTLEGNLKAIKRAYDEVKNG